MQTVKTICTYILELFFPKSPQAFACDKIHPQTLSALVTTVYTSTNTDIFAPLPYKHPYVRMLINQMKYHNHVYAPTVLAQSIAPFLIEELSEHNMYEYYLNPIVIPVPLHSNKLYTRGFNQSERLARTLLETLGETASLHTTALIRHKETAPQAHQISKHARIQNVRNAFMVTHKHVLAGQDVLLVDDVVTTGATLLSAKSALMQAGVRNVLCIAIAH